MGMGNPNMGLQSSLVQLIHFLVLNSTVKEKLTTYIHNRNDHYTVIINSTYKNETISSTGTNKNLLTAILKGIIEFGEEIIRVKHGLNNRSGIAGGLNEENIIERAKSEIIERDSFLYHYRTKKPIKLIKEIYRKNRKFYVYQMSTIDPLFKSVLIKESKMIFEGHEIVHFTTAASRKIENAINKAIEEYFSLEIFLKENKDEVIRIFNDQSKNVSPLYHHIRAISDQRNLQIINSICGNNGSIEPRELKANWNIEKLKSTIKFFKYFKASSDKAIPFELGIPEEGQMPTLFHPFW